MPNQKWTPTQENFLRENYSDMGDKDIAQHICRMGLRVTPMSVRKKRQSMNLIKKNGRRSGIKDSVKRVRRTNKEIYGEDGKAPKTD